MMGRFFPTRFGRMHYTVRGEGKPVLLVHDAYPGRNAGDWEKCAARLSAEYRVYIIDLLGFGCSDRPCMDYSAYLYAALINKFIRKVIRRPATVLGRGRGAAFAVMACAFTPKNFKRIYMIDPTGMPAQPVTIAARASVMIQERHIVRSLLKGFLNADYERALKEIKTPVHTVNGTCGLCKQLLAEQGDFGVTQPDVPHIAGGAPEAVDVVD